ncbi:MAG TPA: ubiquitin-like domain-containing protein [Anaerolineales bacterium]|nr:ubiquitin-like domain-containing protein [Anaerolineales bacterium]
MKRTYILIIILALTGGAIFYITQGIHKTVTLIINDQPNEIQTTAWTISGFLQEQGISLTEEDAIEPPISAVLTGEKVITIEQASWITILSDGVTNSVYTRQNSPEEILSDLGMQLKPDDLLYLDGKLVSDDTILTPGTNHSLQIQRSIPVELTQGDLSETFHTTAPTLGQALWLNGITLDAGDHITPSIDTPLDELVEAELEKSKTITIQFSGGIINSNTTASTVGEALSESGFALQGLDYSRPGANSLLPQDGEIQVIRVREELYLESEPIPYETETQPVADLEIDHQNIVQSGVFGLVTKRIRVRIEDDQEVSRQIEDEYISQEPQSEIIGYGTQIVPHTLDTPGGQIKYWRAVDLYAVSYNVTSNGGYGTATGVPLAKGVAAIDPRYIPYGTRMYIPGYGQALAADTGGGIKGRMIDLGYLDEDYVSWHQWVTVYFLWPPAENIAWIFP